MEFRKILVRLAIGSVAVVGLVTSGDVAEAAGSVRLQRASDPERGVIAKPSTPGRPTTAGQPTVRVSGPLRFSSRQGLRVGRTPVFFGRDTVFAGMETRDALPSPQQLSGKMVSIFGFRTPRGIEAMMVFDRTPDPIGDALRSSIADPMVEPSRSDPRAGKLKAGSQN